MEQEVRRDEGGGQLEALSQLEALADEEPGTRAGEGRPVKSRPRTWKVCPQGTVVEGQSSALNST